MTIVGYGHGLTSSEHANSELAKFWQMRKFWLMTTMNISLPDSLKAFVDRQVSARGYGTSSEYVRELIRKDQDIQRLRDMLLDGAASDATVPVDADYFRGLRDRLKQRKVS